MTQVPSLLETIRIRNGVAPLWYLHLRRLAGSCKALGVPFPGVLTVPEGGADRVQRLEVGPRGAAVTEREVGAGHPVRLSVSRVPHPGYPHKTTDRGAFVHASEEARKAGADDALLLTARGQVAEPTIWCLFWWDQDRLCAPALDLRILQGVSRMRIVEIHGALSEERVAPEALEGRSLFVANAARGIVEVASLDGVRVPSDPRTAELWARFWP
jgi:branched-subunit amino acid aminotransferase/4-amino-4-deoxychorismate lyase